MQLQVQELSKYYGSKRALDHFNYTFQEGIYGILGANGAGKSTLMNLITDNVKRTGGSIFYNGEEILSMGRKFRSLIGYMPQQQGMYEQFSARAFLFYMAEIKGLKKKEAKKQVEELLCLVHLEKDAHRKLGGFSGGMRQRVLLAQALLGNPQVIILDEPTAGLDPKERIRLRNHIALLAQNRIVFLATHIVSDIETIADQVLLMKDGGLIASGTPSRLLEDVGGKNLEDVYMSYLGGE